jgi:hypothetical protein
MLRWSIALFFITALVVAPARAGGDLASDFTLTVATPPEVVTTGASSVTINSAVLNGTANPKQLITTAWFEWGTTPPPPGTATPVQNVGAGNSPVPYTATVTGLLPGTTYHAAAAAQNADGTTYGNDIVFTTPAFTRDSAVNRVVSQIINPSPHKSTLVAFCYDPPGADSTLAAGSTVAPRDSAFVRVLASRSWFFWIDLTGDTRFAHPCTFVYVDAATGAVTTDDGEWWPAVTPLGDTTSYPWKSIDERGADSLSRVYGAYGGDAVPALQIPSARHVAASGPGRAVLASGTSAILVGGAAASAGELASWQSDLDSMEAVLSTPPPLGGPPLADEILVKNDATSDEVRAMIDSVAAHGSGALTFYYTGHSGGRNGGALLLKDGDASYDSLAGWLGQLPSLSSKLVLLNGSRAGIAVPRFIGGSIPVTLLAAADSLKASAGTRTYQDANANNVFDGGDVILSGASRFQLTYLESWRALRESQQTSPLQKDIYARILAVNPDSLKQRQNPRLHRYIPSVAESLSVGGAGVYDFPGAGVSVTVSGIDGPCTVAVTRIFDPPSGAINPADVELARLSHFGYWVIESSPPTAFTGSIAFTLDSTNEDLPYERLRIGTRPAPTIGDPDPLWNNYAPVSFTPAPGGGTILCGNTTHFSQWTVAEAIEQINSVDLEINPRWNIVSVPMNVPDASVAALFPLAVTGAFAFDSIYVPDDTLRRARGYWLKFPGADTVTFGGTQIVRDTFAIKKGWNLVGSVTKPLAAADIQTIPPGIGLSRFFGYARGYGFADSLRPGRGYWVKAAADGEMIFNVYPVLPRRTAADGLSGLNTLVVEDAAGNSQTVYFGPLGSGADQLSADMPPPPPVGAFDVRYASGAWAALYPADAATALEFPVTVTSAAYPLTLRWSVRNAGPHGVSLAGLREIAGEGALRIDRPTPIVLRVEGGTAPRAYRLAQSYPNPFNPTATIAYELPEDAHVTLVVYNVLGEEVARLVDAQKGAGRYTATVDAAAWASGVYFYRLTANAFVEQRKMMLLR